jgi:peptidoglycan/xylan/chitin deacetylase (PgdA/CDA1 family)
MLTLEIIVAIILLFIIVAYLYWRQRYGMPVRGIPPILLYHKVDAQMEWGGTRLPPGWFSAQLHALKDLGYNTILLDEMVELLNDDRTAPLRFLITFDDAYQSLYHYALPVMERLHFKCAIFVISDYIGKGNRWDLSVSSREFMHLNRSEIKEFDALGHTVGAHTRTHRDLTRLTTAEAREEITSSKAALEDLLGKEVRFFSYPFGRYNEAVRQLVIEAGFAGAVASYPRRRNSIQDPYALARRGVYLTDSVGTLKGKVMATNPVGFAFLDLAGRAINSCNLLTVTLQSIRDSRREEGRDG